MTPIDHAARATRNISLKSLKVFKNKQRNLPVAQLRPIRSNRLEIIWYLKFTALRYGQLEAGLPDFSWCNTQTSGKYIPYWTQNVPNGHKIQQSTLHKNTKWL
jgi:hypothetical protein